MLLKPWSTFETIILMVVNSLSNMQAQMLFDEVAVHEEIMLRRTIVKAKTETPLTDTTPTNPFQNAKWYRKMRTMVMSKWAKPRKLVACQNTSRNKLTRPMQPSQLFVRSARLLQATLPHKK